MESRSVKHPIYLHETKAPAQQNQFKCYRYFRSHQGNSVGSLTCTIDKHGGGKKVCSQEMSYMFSTNQKEPRTSTVILMHVFKLDHGEMNPKEHMEMGNKLLRQLSVSAASFQKLKCEEFIL